MHIEQLLATGHYVKCAINNILSILLILERVTQLVNLESFTHIKIIIEYSMSGHSFAVVSVIEKQKGKWKAKHGVKNPGSWQWFIDARKWEGILGLLRILHVYSKCMEVANCKSLSQDSHSSIWIDRKWR